jgi:hypothetical protein
MTTSDGFSYLLLEFSRNLLPISVSLSDVFHCAGFLSSSLLLFCYICGLTPIKSEIGFFFFFAPGALILCSSCSVRYAKAGCKAKVRCELQMGTEEKLSAGNGNTFFKFVNFLNGIPSFFKVPSRNFLRKEFTALFYTT